MARRPASTLWISVAMTVLVVLAGCSGKSKSKDGDPTSTVPGTAPPPTNNGETCSITGDVLDDEALAVPGVTVGLLGTSPLLTTISAQDGRFTFNLVPPGSYQVAASMNAYEPAVQRAVCAPGETAVVHLVLTPMPVPAVPFKWQPQPANGWIGCSVGIPTFATGDLCEGTALDGNPLTNKINMAVPKGNVTGVVLELQWQSTAGLAGGQDLALIYPNPTDPTIHNYTTTAYVNPNAHTVSGVSILKLRIESKNETTFLYSFDQEGSGATWEIRARASTIANVTQNPAADGSSKLVSQQPFTLHVAYFYHNEPIPPNFSLTG